MLRNPGAGRRAVRKEAGRVFPLLTIYLLAFWHNGTADGGLGVDDVNGGGESWSWSSQNGFSWLLNSAARQLLSWPASFITVIFWTAGMRFHVSD